MFRKFLAWILGVLQKMAYQNDIKRVFGTDVAISQPMLDAISLWGDMFLDKAPWLNGTTQSCGLPAAVASEFARLTMVELEANVTGGARGDFLNLQLADVLNRLRESLEVACGTGNMALKPYVTADGTIVVDCVPAWRFFPTAYNSQREVTGAIFPERIIKGKVYYTRMEWHNLTKDGYVVRNLAFRSDQEDGLGQACSLTDVAEWAELAPEATFRYSDGSAPERPLFAVFRVPLANTVDPESAAGVSVYSRAVNLIREADRQYSRILWEYEGSELAVHASEFALRPTQHGGRMPERRKRLFVGLDIDNDGKDFYSVFSPEIRDTALFNGFNQLLRRIEFNCNLAYGTLSDPQNVDKTAEEIRSSKQRSYTAVCEIQKSLDAALQHLVWIMDYYATLYRLAPSGKYELTLTWGDGVLEDVDAEFVRRKQLADSGYLKPEALLAWYLRISEEEARKMMPDDTGLQLE